MYFLHMILTLYQTDYKVCKFIYKKFLMYESLINGK